MSKQKAWLNEYLQCWNASEAARRVGYKWPDRVGPRNKKKLQAEIDARLDEMAMPANEVLARLGKHAAITFDDFVHVIEYDGSGRSTAIVSLAKAKERGVLDCIKKLTYHIGGGYTLELHNAQAALIHLDKAHGGPEGSAIPEGLVIRYVNDWRNTPPDAPPGTADSEAPGTPVQLARRRAQVAQDNATDGDSS